MSLAPEKDVQIPLAADADVEQSISSRFEQIAAALPGQTAIGTGEWQPTYAELNAAANRTAHAILSRPGATGDRAALLLRHNGPLIAAALACLKAGRVLVTLNPTDPAPRLAQILEDADPSLVITDAPNRALAHQIAGTRTVLCVDDIQAGPAENPDLIITPSDLAFLIYTSGSTGKPKAVMQTHRNLLHNARRLVRGMEITSADRILLLASISGGQGIATTLCALTTGATLCPFAAMEQTIAPLAAWLIDHHITVYVSAASVFRAFIRTLDAHTFPAIRLVRLGADAATRDDFLAFQKHFPADAILFNSLSSSETGNITQFRIAASAPAPDSNISVGREPESVEILLLDDAGNPVPNGDPGQITVRGRHLSPGYWRRDDLTAERFGALDPATNLRTFRGGDLARRLPDGSLLFMGRADAQVKIRGYRIELSEIESALTSLPQVHHAAVCPITAPEGDTRLVAYVIPKEKHALTPESLRTALAALLPSHMLPADFILLQSFPLTANGKIDRDALRLLAPSPSPVVTDDTTTPTESLLATIWRTTLRRPTVSRHDDFFALGGDSLSAAVVAARVHAAVNIQLDLRAFAEHPALLRLAAHIEHLQSTGGSLEASPIPRVPRDRPLPLSFAQERAWKYMGDPATSGYVMAMSIQIRGPLNPALLHQAMNFMSKRHDILRTSFSSVDGTPAQIIHPYKPIELPFVDFSADPDPEGSVEAYFKQQATTIIDPQHLPLIHFRLARQSAEEFRLIRINHHLVSDAWSWKVYFHELSLVYNALLHGQPPPIPDFEPIQYADFASWQRTLYAPDQPAYKNAINWWAERLKDGPPTLRLPFRRLFKRRNAPPSQGTLWWSVDPQTTSALNALARNNGVTYYMLRLAAFSALLSHAMRMPEFALGTYVTYRTRLETQNMFGFFANIVTLRFRPDPSQSFLQWLDHVRTQVAQVQAQGAIPYELLCEELRARSIEPPPILAFFTVTEQSAAVQFDGLEFRWLDRRLEAMPWGFTLSMDQHNESRCICAFDARTYSPAQVRKFMDRYAKLLTTISQNPNQSLSQLLKQN